MTFLPNPIFSDKYVYGYEDFDISKWYTDNIGKPYNGFVDSVPQIAKKYNIKVQFILALLETRYNIFSSCKGEFEYKSLNEGLWKSIDLFCENLFFAEQMDVVAIENDIDGIVIEVKPKNRCTSAILRLCSNLSEVLWLYNRYGKMF